MGYRVATLGELSLDNGKYGIAASAVDFDTELPAYLRITDINDDGTLNKLDRKSVNDPSACKYMLSEGDIVFARTGNSTGRNYFYDPRDGKFAFAGFLVKFSLDASKVNPRFVKYYAQSRAYWDWVASFKTGSTRGNINAKTYAQMPIPLPERSAQNSIVALCDCISDKIRINAQLNGYLEELVDALFCEMVLGAVDSSKTVSFSSFLEERKEKCPSRTNAEYSVTDTGIHPRSLKFRKNLSATSSKNKIARKDDLVFGISRRILNWGLFDAEIGEVSSAYRVYSISGVPPEYVARYIARYQCAFTDIIKPSSREGQGIMPDALMTKKLPKLNSFAWEKYLDTVAPIKALASITRTETAALLKSRDSILPKLMSGEIDVSKIDLAKLNSHLVERRHSPLQLHDCR